MPEYRHIATLGSSFQAEGVDRIVVSENAEYSLEEGDLLLLKDTPAYFDDFTGSTPGDRPDRWIPRWAPSSDDYRIARSNQASNGVALTMDNLDSFARRGIQFDFRDTGGTTSYVEKTRTQEVVFKWRGGAETSPRAVVNGAGSSGSEYALVGGISAKGRRSFMYSWIDSSASDSFSAPVDSANHEPGDWWITRFRYTPEQDMRIRSWKATQGEPVDWHRVSSLDSGPLLGFPDSGWVGLVFSTSSDWCEIDWYGVALDGGRAPVGG